MGRSRPNSRIGTKWVYPPGFFWRVRKLIRCRELRNIQFLGVRKLFILLGLRRCVDRTKAT
jgi:hypothetical protein